MVMNSNPEDEASLSQNVKGFRPDVIIVDETNSFRDPNRLMALLREFPEVRLMVININSSLVHIYAKQEIQVAKATDLVAAILRL